ncbi:Dual specificity protein kinase Ttk [Orchesella cincta]|uniref:Dual specificity protein kinase Ttk n=1 Tax=Orchesella cincta TaxID=48709 RepID=A0A1D2NAK7_ORCCI|nr:Dual specificity protein kinase Ttk [Orchesella cincta]
MDVKRLNSKSQPNMPGLVSGAHKTSNNECTSDDKTQPPSTNNSGNKTGGHLRLGGLSRYLMEKVQSNDSGLDLSPGTLQTLVHPIRTSGSSTSSLQSRALFESSASCDESPLPTDSKCNTEPAPTPLVSRSILSEQSHNSSETTVIEKTLTDDTTSKTENLKKEQLGVIQKKSVTDKQEDYLVPRARPYQCSQPTRNPNPDDITPKSRGHHGLTVPYSQQKNSRQQQYQSRNENTDPANSSLNYVHHPNSNSVSSSCDVAAVIAHPSIGDHHARKALNTPIAIPKTCKKKVPTSAKKQTGWKFLSEHVKGKEYLIIKQLGKGGCGEVSLVIEKDSRKLYALKVVQLQGIDEALVQECINEVEMLIELKGTDLVVEIKSWEFSRSEKTMKIVMEHGQCDLNRTIFKSNQPSLLKLKAIWERLLLIVDKIHSRGIVHADLKPANFIWVGDSLKIIDFGIASRLQTDVTSIAMPNPKGTLNFISPETIHLDEAGRSKLSPKSDIWALGCILYLMVYGRTPFEHITHPFTKMNAIVKGDILYPSLPPHLQPADSHIISVLQLCFQVDYKRRPTAGDLLRHSLLRS